MDFSLQDASDAHIAAIAAIWEQGWHDAHSRIVPDILRDLRDTQSFVDRAQAHRADTRVAARDGIVAGFCMTLGDELYQLYVAPDGRGTGLAQALVADAEARIAAAGHATAWLACAVGNTRAMRFYEKAGRRNIGLVSVDLETRSRPFALEVWRYEKRV
ncbi:GNAT family N-acetyltransferase [Thalassococcus sp. CAU 1522]|uniref:GNAT family N-acetyltransferase n=1 Tax=Thalassococcus arenae TaxID=2851652 RepID=A0ABS6N4L4_9RHOB|nr:GNAT family N-acetyltransferase [Thalassococcus arenae]MBV2358954.1 GNAT family N-acetyltransferase [Thalassococcus arenae]